MLKKLNSPWIGSVMGLICFLAVTAATWNAAMAKNNSAGDGGLSDAPPSEAGHSPWLFNNVEVEGLVKELRDEREALAKKEKDLNEFEARLQAERDELTQLTNTVARLQKEFDVSVSRVAEEEITNLKKIAKTYSAMEPEGAASIFRQMDDQAVVKIMMFMKEAETGPILGALSKVGDAEAKRAADLTDKLRLAVPPKKK